MKKFFFYFLYIYSSLCVHFLYSENNYDIQVLFLQDSTTPFQKTVKNLKKYAARDLELFFKKFPTASVALSTFSDKPIPPLGGENDTCFNFISNFSQKSNEIVEKFKEIKVFKGGDLKQNPLEAMLYSLKNDNFAQWISPDLIENQHVIRFMVIITNAAAHVLGDFQQSQINQGQNPSSCLQEDYPSINRIIELLKDRKVLPIFVVPQATIEFYQTFVENSDIPVAIRHIPMFQKFSPFSLLYNTIPQLIQLYMEDPQQFYSKKLPSPLQIAPLEELKQGLLKNLYSNKFMKKINQLIDSIPLPFNQENEDRSMPTNRILLGKENKDYDEGSNTNFNSTIHDGDDSSYYIDRLFQEEPSKNFDDKNLTDSKYNVESLNYDKNSSKNKPKENKNLFEIYGMPEHTGYKIRHQSFVNNVNQLPQAEKSNDINLTATPHKYQTSMDIRSKPYIIDIIDSKPIDYQLLGEDQNKVYKPEIEKDIKEKKYFESESAAVENVGETEEASSPRLEKIKEALAKSKDKLVLPAAKMAMGFIKEKLKKKDNDYHFGLTVPSTSQETPWGASMNNSNIRSSNDTSAIDPNGTDANSTNTTNNEKNSNEVSKENPVVEYKSAEVVQNEEAGRKKQMIIIGAGSGLVGVLLLLVGGYYGFQHMRGFSNQSSQRRASFEDDEIENLLSPEPRDISHRIANEEYA